MWQVGFFGDLLGSFGEAHHEGDDQLLRYGSGGCSVTKGGEDARVAQGIQVG
jgi:hypothetical protein